MANKPLTLALAGILCMAFAAACAPEGPELPKHGTPEARTLYEQCLKTLPEERAADLRRTSTTFYPGEIVKHNDLLRDCVKLQNQNPAP